MSSTKLSGIRERVHHEADKSGWLVAILYIPSKFWDMEADSEIAKPRQDGRRVADQSFI